MEKRESSRGGEVLEGKDMIEVDDLHVWDQGLEGERRAALLADASWLPVILICDAGVGWGVVALRMQSADYICIALSPQCLVGWGREEGDCGLSPIEGTRRGWLEFLYMMEVNRLWFVLE